MEVQEDDTDAEESRCAEQSEGAEEEVLGLLLPRDEAVGVVTEVLEVEDEGNAHAEEGEAASQESVLLHLSLYDAWTR